MGLAFVWRGHIPIPIPIAHIPVLVQHVLLATMIARLVVQKSHASYAIQMQHGINQDPAFAMITFIPQPLGIVQRKNVCYV